MHDMRQTLFLWFVLWLVMLALMLYTMPVHPWTVAVWFYCCVLTVWFFSMEATDDA